MTTGFMPGGTGTSPGGTTPPNPPGQAETDPFAGIDDAAEGHVYTVTGQDWDSIVSEQAERGDERIVVNMGPQHPSTHGVLRLILEMEGESVHEARCGI